MTYQEISTKHNIPVTTLKSRVHHLKLKGTYKSRNVDFNRKQVTELLAYDPLAYLELYRKNNSRRKLKIIEFYQKLGSARKVSAFLNISRSVVDAAAKEFNETGFVTVESKLNKTEYEMDNVNLI